MVEMPGGGLTTMIKTIQSRPAEVKRVIHALQLAKDEVRKSKPKTVELIVRILKMDKEAASDTYDAFQTTLNPTGIPNRRRHRQFGPLTPSARTFHRPQSRFQRNRRRSLGDRSGEGVGIQIAVIESIRELLAVIRSHRTTNVILRAHEESVSAFALLSRRSIRSK